MVAMRTKYIDGDFRTVITKEQYGNMKGRYLNSEDDENVTELFFSKRQGRFGGRYCRHSRY